jgi:MATE family multidrug resistance protein
MVGKLGPTELAAVSLGNSFIFFYCNVIRDWIFYYKLHRWQLKADGKENIEEGRNFFWFVLMYYYLILLRFSFQSR